MKLSVITVVKNDKLNLITSIKSVLSQSFKNYEYIIFDGMSKDGTRSAVKKYLKKNIIYINKKDKNYYDGLNQAITRAKGDYICILNAGDKFYNFRTLQKVSQLISSRKTDFIFGNLIFYNDKGHSKRIWKYNIKKLTMINSLKIASPTLFIKKKIILSLLYDTSLSISADTDFNIRLSKKSNSFIYMNNYIVLMKTGGLSTNPRLYFKKMFQDLKLLKRYFKRSYIFIYVYKLLIKLSNFNK